LNYRSILAFFFIRATKPVSIRIPSAGGRIERIYIRGKSYGEQQRFVQVWGEHYGWKQMMVHLGAPSSVSIRLKKNFYLDPPVGGEVLAEYSLNMTYQSSGIWIGYVGPAELSGSIVKACPQFEYVTQIGMVLSTPDSTILGGSGLEPLEVKEITIDPKAFYETYSSPYGVTCYEAEIK
jgi:hypothetical protein